MESLIISAIFVFGMMLYSKIQEPKRLKREAEKACSYMKYGEVLIHLARLNSIMERDGVFSEKERCLLTALEARRAALKANATPQSIEDETYEYLLMANPERALEIYRARHISDSTPTQENESNANRLKILFSEFLRKQDEKLRLNGELQLHSEKQRMLYLHFVVAAIDHLLYLQEDGGNASEWTWAEETKYATAVEVFGTDLAERRLDNVGFISDATFTSALAKGAQTVSDYLRLVENIETDSTADIKSPSELYTVVY